MCQEGFAVGVGVEVEVVGIGIEVAGEEDAKDGASDDPASAVFVEVEGCGSGLFFVGEILGELLEGGFGDDKGGLPDVDFVWVELEVGRWAIPLLRSI